MLSGDFAQGVPAQGLPQLLYIAHQCLAAASEGFLRLLTSWDFQGQLKAQPQASDH